MIKTISSLVLATIATVATPVLVLAAAPDGAGPWADQVVSFSQGLTRAGVAVPANRSNPDAALGVAENNATIGTFVSLGFGGDLTLKFDNPISNGVVLVETTNDPYPAESVRVELSADGQNWIGAGQVIKDGSVAMPQGLSCARYVRLTDNSNTANFPQPTYDTADGYDVDGVRAAEGTPCDTQDVPFFGMDLASVALIGSGTTIFIARKYMLQ